VWWIMEGWNEMGDTRTITGIITFKDVGTDSGTDAAL